jgi:hypothetical protein
MERFRDDAIGTSIVIVRNPKAMTVFNQLLAEGRAELETASEKDVVESQSEYFAFSTPARQMINKLNAAGKFAPAFRLPYQEDRHPSFMVWYKNYLNPAFFRFVNRQGFGYLWFFYRVALLKLLTPVIILLNLAKPIARKFLRKTGEQQ